MTRPVWKHLPAGELEAFRAHLEGLPAEGRPRYGLLGVKSSWWSRLGGGARPFAVLVADGRVTLSKRTFRKRAEISRHEYPAADLKAVKVRRGPLLEGVRLTFADGYRFRVGGLPRGQGRPLERFLAGEADALDPAGLGPEQLTNFFQTMQALGLPAGGEDDAPEPAQS